MTNDLSLLASVLFKGGAGLVVANEIRGTVLAGPVLYGAYQAGGSAMAVWLAICSLAGIALSVAGPMVLWRRLNGKRKASGSPLITNCSTRST